MSKDPALLIPVFALTNYGLGHPTAQKLSETHKSIGQLEIAIHGGQLSDAKEKRRLLEAIANFRRDYPTSKTPKRWETAIAFGVCVYLVVYFSIVAVFDVQITSPLVANSLWAALSLSLAALAIAIPGFIQVEIRWVEILIRAGGPIAIFILVFFFGGGVLPRSQAVQPAPNYLPITNFNLDEFGDPKDLVENDGSERWNWLEWSLSYWEESGYNTLLRKIGPFDQNTSGFEVVTEKPNGAGSTFILTAFVVTPTQKGNKFATMNVTPPFESSGRKYQSFTCPQLQANEYILMFVVLDHGLDEDLKIFKR